MSSSSSFSRQFDVLVVGAGAAGLYTSLCLPTHFRVGLITKDELLTSASEWAQGGIAAPMAADDSPELHIEDTLRAGAGLCDRQAVTLMVQQAPDCIRDLLAMGVLFDRHGADLAMTLEAAHSRRRVLHAADTTGRAVVSILAEQVLQRPNIHVMSQGFALDLWLTETGDRCLGVVAMVEGQLCRLAAGAVVLATGGGGQVFAQTTNPALSTGDGVAMAWRGGAVLRDLEFVQFHPTALTKPGAPRFLVSEAVRGEGAHLVDDEGRRFAFDYHPEGELAPRDVVSRAIFSYLQSRHPDPAHGHVWLDLRPIPPETIQRRFPNIVQVCRQWGVDVFQAPVPVAPAAHYWMGGVLTDLHSQTSIAGLYAVGETSSTGVHGANRLASNSLLECLVFGAQLRHVALPENWPAAIAPNIPNDPNDPNDPNISNIKELGNSPSLPPSSAIANWESQKLAIQTIRQNLPPLVWQAAGICREQQSLERAIAQIQEWRLQFAALPLSQFLNRCPLHLEAPVSLDKLGLTPPQMRAWGETRNLLDVAYLLVKSAAFRTESRGGHYRSDYPYPNNTDWQAHTLIQSERWWKSSVEP
ncbi:L-aspartate oxidase [Thermoleptolyngbya sp. C42_A2020_037]|uniref:L-aspartate oxidase n=1 Tax=Thermoleptolyngbya sp. C42_A2020_037 TaxID=2747799 RepID=UPI001A0925FB|nr:L-aspartate oxidase [Thermoleptolyngbya sp. C42_A2020_037]MBF2084890.1 L-aspartate oxidase [Thermoleptolyngbya sp. C42_A2020_037]